MELVYQLRNKARQNAVLTGFNEKEAQASQPVQKQVFADPRQTEKLTDRSLRIIEELDKMGHPLPPVVNNAALINELEIAQAL